MDRDTIRFFRDSLAVPSGSLRTAANPKRADSIAEAAAWPSGPDQLEKAFTPVFSHESGYSVALGKPGKEAAPGYEPSNPYDMTPVVHVQGNDVGYTPSFEDLFVALQAAAAGSAHGGVALDILGHLLVRNAFMFDHEEVANGVWRYRPPEPAVGLLESNLESVDGLPPRVFLHVLDSIALNEDVKYTKRAGELGAAGRPNMLLTFAHLCAVFLGRSGIGSFAGRFARQPIGISALTQDEARRFFPLLEPDEVRIDVGQRTLGPAARKLDRYRGRSAKELAAAGAVRVAETNKGRLRLITDALLARDLSPSVHGRLRAATLKTIRVDRDMRPVEDISFAAFDLPTLLSETWHGSAFRRDLRSTFLVCVFEDGPKGEEIFLGPRLLLVPLEDIELAAQPVWRATVDALRAARRDALPPAKAGPFFVRNHAGSKVVNEAGETVTPLSFWLSKHYMQSLLVSADD